MKKWLIMMAAVMLAAVLAACGTGAAQLTRTLETSDGNFSFSVPSEWDYYDGAAEETLVLHMSDGSSAFAKVYYFSWDEYDYPFETCLDDLTGYYGDNIIGEVNETQAGSLDASRFEYNMVDLSEDNEKVDYHGYEYVIEAPNGVLDIDIFYAQDQVLGKIFQPSKDQLELLDRIVQSLEVNN